MKSDRDARHKRAMQRKKEYVDGRIAAATEDRGLLLILTGNGKGKSSSAFGMLARSVGHGLRCAVVQFIKGAWECGERLLFEDNPLVEFHIMGTGFTWETQDRQTDIAAAEAAWSKAEALLADEATDLVILDELTYMLTYGYLDKARVLEALRGRPARQHVVVTGRNASRELLEIADTVSEVNEVRHAFNHGVKAQKGLDY
ncbi:MAG: cob(I)yrinic acid a,c-diamide adenosyltransferase [Gammaproteobacteria bacterium]|nr:cob(I)yrinic acid a,c-diamide adenosyltransferase [Gammaproteobacteria bacterium]MXZ31967.1 cob(I)yrinic acid a,c-diamide adenosyltransferase [Gammaproteobacteria bacterium]MYA65952.1 cob(I)yrinic acid a,c-diamide adenosyltransferase [Gammaproteobacteria bacterium]MYF00475.1 cob(I)yrinic acid a,c-diamide adenosyltransferase [Gammaproteobacteria bacterium]MYG95448.1 cob(I)yrinic acid a,c-diamide adenosyltransferase [Gammaproteobacteria bacterium]